ncbi:hypothetical protein [Chlorogloeopsis sp. ULAP02]|uniref:hypothetical protein n=1 Tax=Chlorogloeopsis sp. ULAP02 TaxID=3107926 RepID=UPI003137385F
MSWDEAVEFCERLSNSTGKDYLVIRGSTLRKSAVQLVATGTLPTIQTLTSVFELSVLLRELK